ncbi:helix-turn-helix domain-containing protein [Microbulbifer pacificus]|uniref:AraC family transcriptional regulator n=1 Tax=Microbulbifer pacificus TaxID=407164 RepID=A0AAU0N1J7_9GAMM|nr:helix-turn-helix domain-containing protein [Microbulbifer pacificus]WOX06909.1 AraC family transcriptional regulator [Microbulbifer pacificus]
MAYLSRRISDIAPGLLPGWSGARLRELFLTQPNAHSFIERWRSKFMPEVTLAPLQVVTFLNEFLATHQLVDNYFESLTIFGASRRKRGELGDIQVSRPLGSSSSWCLMFTTEGSGEFNCIRQTFVSSPGDMLLLAPGALYEFRRHHEDALWESYWFYSKPPEAVMNRLNWSELGPYIYHQRVPVGEIQRIKHIFQQMFELESPTEDLSQAIVENLVEQIFLWSFQYAHRSGGAILDSRVKTALSFISDHLYEDFTIEDVASASGLSRARLSKLFKAYTGRSILQWRDERRMSDACHALAQDNASVQAVAHVVGYDDPLYFSRKFTQIVGVSPRHYQRARQRPSAEE